MGNWRRGASAVVIRVHCWNVAQQVRTVAELLDTDDDVVRVQFGTILWQCRRGPTMTPRLKQQSEAVQLLIA